MRSKIRITEITSGDESLLFEALTSRPEIDKAFDICIDQIARIDEEIARDNIPFPERLLRRYRQFDIRSENLGEPRRPDVTLASAIGGTDSTNIFSRVKDALWSEPIALVTVPTLLFSERRPGSVVIVGDRRRAIRLGKAISVTGLRSAVYGTGYGLSGQWILEGYLRRPEKDSLLHWLGENCDEALDETAMIVFLTTQDICGTLPVIEQCAPSSGLPVILKPITSGECKQSLGGRDANHASSPLEFGSKRQWRASDMQRQTPRISIVTVSFNQAEYLKSCLKSVIQQEYENLEYIVIDGGYIEIIERYRTRLDKVIIEADEGQSDALNKGFACATDEVMTWLCSDDLLEPHSVADVADA